MYRQQSRYPVSYVLIGINLAVFLLMFMEPRLGSLLALSPRNLLVNKYLWTIITYMFVHGGFSHLLFNTIFFIVAGPELERRMGRREFLLYYLICGALAGFFSLVAYTVSGQNVAIYGASGALYAIMLAFATFYPRAQILLFFVLPLKAPYALALFAAIDVFSHITGRIGVAHLTHLSGLIFGFLYFLLRFHINPIKVMKDNL